MATVTVRNIENETKQRLRLRAARKGHSLEEELRSILRNAAAGSEDAHSIDNLYGHAVATRNVWDFGNCGVNVINPWDASAP